MSSQLPDDFRAMMHRTFDAWHSLLGPETPRFIDEEVHRKYNLPGLASERSARSYEQIRRDRQALIRILTDEFMHISQIHAALGTADNANVTPDLQVLRREGRVEMGKRGYYRLTPPRSH